jgi:hypothetical protein
MNPPNKWPFDTWVDLDRFPEEDDFLRLAKAFLLGVQHSFLEDSALLRLATEGLVLGFTYSNTLNFESRRMAKSSVAIGIDASAAFQLMDAFKCLLASTGVPPALGVSSPIVGPYALHRYEVDERSFRALTDGEQEAPELTDPVATDCWDFLVQSALRFTYFHELGHILGGHVIGSIAAGSNERRARELYADHKGAIAAISRLAELSLDGIIGTERFYLWGVAIGIMFGLIETFTRDDKDRGDWKPPIDGGDPYPRGGLRGFWVSQALAVIDIDWRDELGRRVNERISAGFEAARAAWEAAGWGHIAPPSVVEIKEIRALLGTRPEEESSA